MKGPTRLLAVVFGIILLGAVGLGAIGCRRDATLGPPDSFLVFAPLHDPAGAPVRSPAGLDVVEPVAPDDPRAEPLYKQLAIGFPAEVLRTDYLAKQLVREIGAGARPYAGGARNAAGEPTVFVVGAGRGTVRRRPSSMPWITRPGFN